MHGSLLNSVQFSGGKDECQVSPRGTLKPAVGGSLALFLAGCTSFTVTLGGAGVPFLGLGERHFTDSGKLCGSPVVMESKLSLPFFQTPALGSCSALAYWLGSHPSLSFPGPQSSQL